MNRVLLSALVALLCDAATTPTFGQCETYSVGVLSPNPAFIPGVDDTGNHVDDTPTTAITFPFFVSFYGTDYAGAQVSSNGNLQFASNVTAYTNNCLPSATFPGPTIFLMWDDLYTAGAAAGQGIFTTTVGSAPNRKFVVEWRVQDCCSAAAPIHNFEVIFYEGANFFDVLYQTVATSGTDSTVGVQASATGPFTQYSCSTAASASPSGGLALRFACPYIEPSVGCCDVVGVCTLAPQSQCIGPNIQSGATCSPSPCTVLLGGCCLAGQCNLTTAPGCATPSIFHGIGSVCSPTPCPQLPDGACCTGVTCSITTEVACAGRWTPNQACGSPNPCDQVFLCTSEWTERPVSGPSPIYYHASAYDSVRHRTVVFGGSTGCGTNETWEFDGNQWFHPLPATRPPPRTDENMAFDSLRGVCVLYGGYPQCNGSVLTDTWEWDGINWSQRTSSNGMTPPTTGTMCFDTAAGVTLLARPDGSGQLWQWDGSMWTLRPLAGVTPTYPVLMYHSGWNAVLLTDSRQQPQVSETIDLYRLEGNSWTLLDTHVFSWPPSGRNSGYSPVVGKLVMYRGEIFTTSETWMWDGAWQPIDIPNPPNRTCSSFVYDSFRDRFVLFGGHDESGLRGDTWDLRFGGGGAVRFLDTPQGATVPSGSPASLSATVTGSTPIAFTWKHGGVAVVNNGRISGADSSTISFSPAHLSDAGEYTLEVSNTCGRIVSSPVTLTVTCRADFNHTGVLSVQDLFDFLASYFAGEFRADFNNSLSITVQDIFDFLAAYFAGCP